MHKKQRGTREILWVARFEGEYRNEITEIQIACVHCIYVYLIS